VKKSMFKKVSICLIFMGLVVGGVHFVAFGEEKEKTLPFYVGSHKCKACHNNEYKQWKKTKMAKAFKLLKPGVRAEAKKKM